jgi:hypothetical protein
MGLCHEKVRYHLENDDFFDVGLFVFDEEKVLTKYKKVMDYGLHHKILK